MTAFRFSRALGLGIAEHLDVVEHTPAGLFAGPLGSAPFPFALEQVEEAFSDSVIVAVPHELMGRLHEWSRL